MAEAPSRTLFTGQQVLDLIDSDAEDFDDAMDEVFFPGSDDELGFVEEEIDDGGRLVKNNCARISKLPYSYIVVMMKVVETNKAMTVALGM